MTKTLWSIREWPEMYITYHNPVKRYVAIHEGSCVQTKKANIVHHDWFDKFATLNGARTSAKRQVTAGHAREWGHCQKCMPGIEPWLSWMDRRGQT